MNVTESRVPRFCQFHPDFFRFFQFRPGFAGPKSDGRPPVQSMCIDESELKQCNSIQIRSNCLNRTERKCTNRLKNNQTWIFPRIYPVIVCCAQATKMYFNTNPEVHSEFYQEESGTLYRSTMSYQDIVINILLIGSNLVRYSIGYVDVRYLTEAWYIIH